MKFFKLLIVFIVIALKSSAQDTTRLSLLFTGDIMGHDSQIASAYDAKTGTYDYASCFQFVKPYISSVDLAIGNLEVTLAGPPYKGYPQFSSPDNLAKTLKDVGFDVLVTANNHSADRGKKGIERTLTMLDSVNILHTGTFADEVNRMNDYPLILRKNGFTVSLLNYTYGTNGMPVTKPNVVNMIDTAQMRKDLIKSREARPDITIVFMHWGVEYQNLHNKQQQQLANFCFNNGADMVIGAHPHVLQPMEWRKNENKLVVYSLGNFVSGQRDRYKDGGAMLYADLKKISYRPDSAVTTIDSAGYYLQWVYRTVDANKDYYILPVPSFENDQTKFIKDEVSRLALQTFARDSRSLFSKHNVNLNEIKEAPVDSLLSYKVIVKNLFKDQEEEASVESLIDTFYGYEIEREGENTTVLLGNFRNRTGAEKLYQKLVADGREVEIGEYANGKIVASYRLPASESTVTGN